MSYNVLILAEDFRKDQFVLKPIIEALLAHIGKPRANVQVCREPNFGGISNAMSWEKLSPVLNRYRGSYHLILLLVDRDGDPNRRAALSNLEANARNLYNNVTFFAENAWQEVEVWALAGCTNLPANWQWNAVRAEINLKEQYFTSYSQQCGYSQLEHEGRKEIAEIAARNYSRIRTLCPEDIQQLETHIQASL